jgi:hypothetical protein
MNTGDSDSPSERASGSENGVAALPRQVVIVLFLLLAVVVASIPVVSMWRTVALPTTVSAPTSGTSGCPPDVTGSGSYRLRDLTLAPNREAADRVLLDWATPARCAGQPTRLEAARRAAAVDDEFVRRYAAWLWLLPLWACAWFYMRYERRPATRAERAAGWIHVLVVVILLALFLVDHLERGCLERLLTADGVRASCSILGLDTNSLVGARMLTQLQLSLLALIAVGIVLAAGISIRRECHAWRAGPDTRRQMARKAIEGRTFGKLIDHEHKGIVGHHADERCAVRTEAAGEPWVHQCAEEFVGLALSGGGIRSATFNLGLLQGLHRLDLLRHIDYVATVSGGGYIGGFWSRWLRQHATNGQPPEKPLQAPDEPFPDEVKASAKNLSGDTRVFESAEVRHIREFSKFLVPRTGVFDTEMWGAVVAWLASLVPALVGALSVLGLSLVGWLMLTFYLACPNAGARTLFAFVLTTAVLFGMECWWRTAPTSSIEPDSWKRVAWRSLLAIGLVSVLAWIGLGDWPVGTYRRDGQTWVGQWRPVLSSYEHWWGLVGISGYERALMFSPRLYEPSAIWILVAGVLLLFRFRGAFAPPTLGRRVRLSETDRTAMRLLGVSTLWALLATFWHIGINLRNFDLFYQAVTGAAGAGGLFALLRNWIGQSLAKPQKAGWWDRLKPYIPQVLAYLAVGLAWAALASALIMWGRDDWYQWYLAAVAMATVALLLLLVDPAEFGLHAFYRDRICRAYLGASRPIAKARPDRTQPDEVLVDTVADNRKTDFLDGDDVLLEDLLERPLHLVCCAANDLSGDHLATLSRGAQSAVLSRYGIAIGPHWATQPTVQLGSALTASAAAFNSNMGTVSMEVGPAVSFLMSALNLRLGLWVAGPQATRRAIPDRLLPGWLFYKEMFASTSADGPDVHLSDGAHFDNLGLYELVRRHCRYVIVSDCTADPEVAFDDFGNTARRIREDFGVEIAIDLDPLRPGPDGRAQQHAVVGTIDYGWFDKGIIVYVKPTLTGDEPPDTRQYKTRNATFPHESTGDQFYDEAQWESYRRLGVHSAREVFAFAERIARSGGRPREDIARVQAIFATAAQVWHPGPPGLLERVLQMSTRFAQLEEELKLGVKVPMVAELFPELEIGQLAFLGPRRARGLGPPVGERRLGVGHVMS